MLRHVQRLPQNERNREEEGLQGTGTGDRPGGRQGARAARTERRRVMLGQRRGTERRRSYRGLVLETGLAGDRGLGLPEPERRRRVMVGQRRGTERRRGYRGLVLERRATDRRRVRGLSGERRRESRRRGGDQRGESGNWRGRGGEQRGGE